MSSTDVIVENTGESFACPSGTIILDAGLAAGLHMPHSCRGGACGTCKALVVEGEVDHGWVMSFAITDEEKEQGYCLTCQSKPLSPTLRLRTVEPMRPKRAGEEVILPMELTAEVVAAESVTPSIRRLVLALPRGTRFRFRPGMNLEFVAPGLSESRPYSIIDAPGADGLAPDGQLSFFITRHPHGRCSTWVHSLSVGDTVNVRGPYGEFGLPDAGDRPVLALAGGSGLSPILSVIGKALAEGHKRRIELLFSVRDRRELFALDVLARLAHRHENFSYRVTLTRDDAAPPPWLRGRIPLLLTREARNLSEHVVLVAGSPAFVDDCVAAALASNAAADRIVTDSFLPRTASVASPSG